MRVGKIGLSGFTQRMKTREEGDLTSDVQDAIRRFRESRERCLEPLKEWLSIASISTDPSFAPEMRRAADWAAKRLKRIGFGSARLIGPETHPAVLGEMPCGRSEAPTALIYGHYDVQPCESLDGWSSPPFSPALRGDRLYARGSADMKGPVWSALCALESLAASSPGLRFNVKVLLEGEEEIGSPHLKALIEEYRESLQCDFCLNLDSGMPAPDLPTLSSAFRGIASFDLKVMGPCRDLHSGEYGGVVHNPAQVISELIAGLHSDSGRVALPGFYDRVRDLDDRERSRLSALPIDERSFLEQAGVFAAWGEAGYSAQERIGSRPTLEIHGLRSGFAGEGAKTIVPAAASAKLSTRLVPDQDPWEVGRQLEEYLRVNAPSTVSWRLDQTSAVPPAESSVDSPWARGMIESFRLTWNCEPLIRRIGGTIPIVGLLQRNLGVDAVNTGWALPDGNLHSADENLHLPTFCKGVESLIRFFGRDEPARFSANETSLAAPTDQRPPANPAACESSLSAG